MNQLAQLTLPGRNNEPQVVVGPSSIPEPLQGGFSLTGVNLITFTINTISLVGGTIALIMIIWSGIQIITSSGDPAKMARGKSRLFFAIIGLIVMLASYFIVNNVLKLTGTNTGNLL